MKKNINATRTYSDAHEKSVCKALNGLQQSNSGAGNFRKGDVVIPTASMLCECKTSMTEKQSVSIKKEWIDKNKEEAFAMRLDNQCICFNFGPDTKNYYVIDETLMRYLCEKLEEEFF